jgi:putative acetyltransferase
MPATARFPIEVREEEPGDETAIRDLNQRAFEQNQEADIVDALRSNGGTLLSLVATLNGQVAGHITYSPATIGRLRGAALGPMAVLPELQCQGIGSQLVEEGNRRVKERGSPFVIVVGHADFYPRFGFRPARERGIACEWDLPPDVFMVLVLDDDQMKGLSGVAKYRKEFSSVS